MVQALQDFATWLIALLLYIPQKTWELLLDGLATVIEALPAPDFVLQTANALAGLGNDVLFWLNLFQAPAGVSMFISSMLLRFLIRRIPLIG